MRRAAQPLSAHVCTTLPPGDAANAITALRKRLNRWELEHLRTHCAELADRLELALQRIDSLESEVSRAWSYADSWRDQTQELMTELEEAGKTIGLTQDGALVVMATEGGAT